MPGALALVESTWCREGPAGTQRHGVSWVGRAAGVPGCRATAHAVVVPAGPGLTSGAASVQHEAGAHLWADGCRQVVGAGGWCIHAGARLHELRVQEHLRTPGGLGGSARRPCQPGVHTLMCMPAPRSQQHGQPLSCGAPGPGGGRQRRAARNAPWRGRRGCRSQTQPWHWTASWTPSARRVPRARCTGLQG